MNPTLLQNFIKLIANYTGLHIREPDYNSFCHKILMRISSLKYSSPEEYYQLLISQDQTSKNEWEKLIILLTVTETYFFRDQEQLGLLKNVILPEIIKFKIASNQKKISIWSAGCSTGEEPYSLAIIIQELIPGWQEWDILILGTDINKAALTKAKQGIYSDWSFRLLDEWLKRKYFYQFQGEWQLNPIVKNMVSFSNINLVKDSFPKYIDLILCRNVFIYFEPKYTSLVMQKFYNSLLKGGYLITGHAELFGQTMSKFRVKFFPKSLVYQRDEEQLHENYLVDTSPILPKKTIPITKSFKRSFLNSISESKVSTNYNIQDNDQKQILFDCNQKINLNHRNETARKLEQKNSDLPPNKSDKLLLEAAELFAAKAYTNAIKKVEKFMSLNPQSFRGYKLLARLYANVGKYDRAIFYCNQAIKVNASSLEPYYLLVNIAEEQGDIEGAKIFLKRIIYLYPQEVPAYIELGSLYAAEKNIIRAKKMKNTALELLKNLPADDMIEYRGGIKVSELIKYLEA
ncbi:CheR family methyltransferase [Okeania sp.]|uniref:CheR family methyltransferase n=1 Tax=Okeania sp. TaxID=3100323 RepID=UPI002B4B62E1|nr:CheR family methyltransferase [Okeania sp.]MEB3341568.1 CheR family methyltransferase [Okeania sp.]